MDDLRKKILYQSWHRGCKETDVVLGPFAEGFLPSCNQADLDTFIALLQEDDWDIWQWITQPKSAPAQHYAIISAILSSRA